MMFQAQRLLDSGKTEDAQREISRVLEREPGNAAAHRLMSVALTLSGRYMDALMHARDAVGHAPDDPESHRSLGRLQGYMGYADEATDACRRAVELAPGNAVIRAEFAQQLTKCNRPLDAVAACREGMGPGPNDPALVLALGRALLAAGRPEEACEVLAAGCAAHPRHLMLAESRAMAMNYASGISAEDTFAAHTLQARLAQAAVKPLVLQASKPDLDPDRKLRIGIMSPDLWAHAVGTFLEPLIEHLDRGAFEVTLYSTDAFEDHITARLESLASQYRRLGHAGPRTVAQTIAQDRIDILIELSGLTANHRLPVMLLRPARVQATYLGYPNTTGTPLIDWRIVDSLTDPSPAADGLATERLARLDPCFVCYRPPVDAPDPGPLPLAENGRVTFGSFNDLKKLSRDCVELWSAVLAAVPGSRLVLKSFGLAHEQTRTDISAQFAAKGVDPSRLELLGPIKDAEGHLAAYRCVDIALDSFPYHGTTTTCEALAMGVPVVTLAGDRHASRVGVSLLTHAGLAELIAPDRDSYVRIGAGLASDPGRLAALRSSLRGRLASSALGDAPAYAGRFGEMLRTMWRGHVLSSAGKKGRS